MVLYVRSCLSAAGEGGRLVGAGLCRCVGDVCALQRVMQPVLSSRRRHAAACIVAGGAGEGGMA
jgi:hypothetical protein